MSNLNPHQFSGGSLPPGYDLQVVREEEKTERWGHPALEVAVSHGGKRVAGLGVFQRPDQSGSVVAHPNIWVDEEHQHKGVATAMYAEVHKRWVGTPIQHSPHASEAAQGLNQTLGQRFGSDLHRTR